jgi:hypothetical protein
MTNNTLSALVPIAAVLTAASSFSAIAAIRRKNAEIAMEKAAKTRQKSSTKNEAAPLPPIPEHSHSVSSTATDMDSCPDTPQERSASPPSFVGKWISNATADPPVSPQQQQMPTTMTRSCSFSDLTSAVSETTVVLEFLKKETEALKEILQLEEEEASVAESVWSSYSTEVKTASARAADVAEGMALQMKQTLQVYEHNYEQKEDDSSMDRLWMAQDKSERTVMFDSSSPRVPSFLNEHYTKSFPGQRTSRLEEYRRLCEAKKRRQRRVALFCLSILLALVAGYFASQEYYEEIQQLASTLVVKDSRTESAVTCVDKTENASFVTTEAMDMSLEAADEREEIERLDMQNGADQDDKITMSVCSDNEQAQGKKNEQRWRINDILQVMLEAPTPV